MSPTLPTGIRDPGLQPERTGLSWRRTSLAVLGNGLLLNARDLFGAPISWTTPTFLGAALSVVITIIVFAFGRRRATTLLRDDPHRDGYVTSGSRSIITTGLCVIILCLSLPVAALI